MAVIVHVLKRTYKDVLLQLGLHLRGGVASDVAKIGCKRFPDVFMYRAVLRIEIHALVHSLH